MAAPLPTPRDEPGLPRPDWAERHLQPGERVRFARDVTPAGRRTFLWGLAGVSIGLAYAGSSMFVDIPGPFSFLAAWTGLDERVQVPAFVGAFLGFLTMAGYILQGLAEDDLAAYVVTDRRLVRIIRLGPGVGKAWPLAEVVVKKIQTDGEIKLKVPHDTISYDAGADRDAFLCALRP